jgi:hypothetical protein
MPRSFAAITLGFLVVVALSFGGDEMLRLVWPSAFGMANRVVSAPALLIVIGYVFISAVIGCYVTARIAPNAPLVHALVLGGIALVLNIVGTVARWSSEPPWYHIAVVALVMPAAWVGGTLGARGERGRRN